MRSVCVTLLVLCLAQLPVAADDWSVRRSPFDPRIVARYKALLLRRPNDTYALNKLISLYKKHRTLTALIAEYKRRAHAAPRSFALQVILGNLYRRAGNRPGAVQHLRQAQQLNPKSSAVAAALAKLYRQQGEVAKARTAYQRALELAGSKRAKMRYLRALANMALAQGDLKAARQRFDQLLQLDPKNNLLRMELAQALAKGGHQDEAIAQYRSLLKRTADSARKADILKEIGKLLQSTGKHQQAIATYRHAMRLTARGHWLRRELTDRIISIHRQQETLPALIAHYEKTWKRRGHFEHFVLAKLYDETGNEAKALAAYRAALKAAPHTVEARVRLIALLERSGRDKEVIQEYRRLARIAPGEPRYQLELAKRLYLNGRQKEALAILDRCGQRFASDASVHSALADLYGRWGQQGRALRSAQLLVRIEPSDPSHLINLGEQLYMQGKKRRAVETWRRLLRVIPKRHTALVKLAEVFGQHEMSREAIALLRKAVKLKPKDHLTYRALALLLEQKRRTSDALGAWDKVRLLCLGKGQATARKEARRHIIDILHRTYQLRGSIRAYRTEFEAGSPPANLEAGFMLAAARIKLGNMAGAAEVYEQIIQLDKDNLEAMTALEATYRRQRKLAQAVKLLKRMAKLQPTQARDYYQRIASLLLQLYNDEEALVYAHKAAAMGSRDARSYERLGRLYERKEDYAAAMKAYRQAMQLAPHRFAVHFALARLLTLHGKHAEADAVYRRVLRTAKTPEVIRRAFRLGVELGEYLGTLKELEREVIPLSVTTANGEVYREVLVGIYRRRIPPLIDRARQGSPSARREAMAELTRIGVRGLSPLLEELARPSARKERLVRMLGYLRNPNAVLPLARLAQEQEKDEVIVIRSRGSYGRYYSRFRNSKLMQQMNRRVEATVAMGRIGDARAAPALERLLGDRDGPVRDAAAWSLARAGTASNAASMLSALGDPRDTVQALGCVGLGIHGGDKSHAVLQEVFQDPERSLRVRAACGWALGASGAKEAMPALVRALSGGDRRLARSAARALGLLRLRQAVPALVRALWSKDQSVRRVVQHALMQTTQQAPAPTRRPSLPDVAVRQGKVDVDVFLHKLTGVPAEQAAAGAAPQRARGMLALLERHQADLVAGLSRALTRHRDVVLRILTDLDQDRDRLSLGLVTRERSALPPSERARMRRVVAAIGAKILPRVQRLLEHRDTLIRRRAVSVLAKLNPPDLVRRLESALGDSDWRVRIAALGGMAHAARKQRRTGTHAVAALRRALGSARWREREEAARLAGELHGTEVARALARAARDANGFVRQAAVTSLGEIGQRAGAAAARVALRDEVPRVRAAACAAVARLRVPQLRQLLAPLTRDPDAMVRRAAKRELARLPHPG